MSFLQVKSITKRFGGLVAVNDLSFEMQEKEILSLIGPNGAGKTTTINMITNFISPDTGGVEFNGRNVTGQEPHSIAKLGMIRTFQKTHIFPLVTVQDNIKMGCHKITACTMVDIIFHSKKFRQEEKKVDQKVLQILEFFQMIDLKGYLAKNLSYGQKRILEIAIAMACEPKLLMLDEPLGALDRSLRERLVLDINRILRITKQTAVYVTHDQEEAFAIADRVVLMNSGEIIQTGTPQEIYRQPISVRAARFLGMSNILSGEAVKLGGESEVKTKIGLFHVVQDIQGPVDLLIRPDIVNLNHESDFTIAGNIIEKSFQGSSWKIVVDVHGEQLVFNIQAGKNVPQIGESARIAYDPKESLLVFPKSQ